MTRFTRRQRTGFTLIELLVVIGIIGILFTLTAGAVFKTISVRKITNTRQTVQKLYLQLQRQMKAVIDDARTEPIPQNVLNLAGGDQNRARVIWIKLRLKQQFPQSYAEALQPAPGYISPEPIYGKVLAGKSAANNPLTEPGACLLMALTARDRRGAGQVADFLSSLEVHDTDGDGVPEVCDAFGNPLAFFRWPTPPLGDPNYIMLTTKAPNGWNPNSPPPSPTPPTPSGIPFQDPQDPTGTLQAPNWTGSGTFAGLCHPVLNQYMVPVIVSAGPDGGLVLNPNMSVGIPPPGPPYVSAADNIYSDPRNN